jgi:hypothetical protein
MASLFAATIYGANSNDWTGTGKAMAFSPTQVVLRSISPAESYAGVACNAAIQLLPTAPSVIQPIYYTASSIGDLLTAANNADS